jgi:hypothetical protein
MFVLLSEEKSMLLPESVHDDPVISDLVHLISHRARKHALRQRNRRRQAEQMGGVDPDDYYTWFMAVMNDEMISNDERCRKINAGIKADPDGGYYDAVQASKASSRWESSRGIGNSQG